MAFDDVAADLRRVAGTERLRHARLALDHIHLRGGDFLDLETVLAHVLGPLAAAAAVGVLVHDDLFARGVGGGEAGQAEQCGGEQGAQGAALRLRGDVHDAVTPERNFMPGIVPLPQGAWAKLTGM